MFLFPVAHCFCFTLPGDNCVLKKSSTSGSGSDDEEMILSYASDRKLDVEVSIGVRSLIELQMMSEEERTKRHQRTVKNIVMHPGYKFGEN